MRSLSLVLLALPVAALAAPPNSCTTADIEALSAKLDALSAHVTSETDATLAAVDGVSAQVDAVATDVSGVSAAVDGVATQVTDLEAQLGPQTELQKLDTGWVASLRNVDVRLSCAGVYELVGLFYERGGTRPPGYRIYTKTLYAGGGFLVGQGGGTTAYQNGFEVVAHMGVDNPVFQSALSLEAVWNTSETTSPTEEVDLRWTAVVRTEPGATCSLNSISNAPQCLTDSDCPGFCNQNNICQ